MKMDKKIKIKPLSKSQILISIDRLTRFKPTEEKYFRVFAEIVCSNLIFPKYKKQDLNSMPYSDLTSIVEKIFEFSFFSFGLPKSDDFSINKKLFEYEKSVFKFDKNVENLLDNKIDYNAALTFFEGGVAIPYYSQGLPPNMKWLKSLSGNENQIENRANFGLKFPVEKIIIAEGITEEILLPKFAQALGHDFDKLGINLMSAGGKNQVVKLFYKFADVLNLPIFVLLDNDAKENYDEIQPKLRTHDEIYILKKGEFEDLLPLSLIKRTLNRHLKNFYSIKLNDLRSYTRMTKTLDNLFKQCGLEFKKAAFANLVRQNIKSDADVSQEISEIISAILK